MTSGVAVGKSSSRISTWVHSSGAMNVTVSGGPAGEVHGLRGRARPAYQITPARGKASPGAISPVTTSAPSRTVTLELGGTAGHLVRRHVPCAEARLEPGLEVRDQDFRRSGRNLGLRPDPRGGDCTLHEIPILPDRDDVHGTQYGLPVETPRFAAAKAGSVDWSSTVVTPKRSASLSDDPALLAVTPVPDSSCSMPASPRFSSTGCRADVRLPTCRGTAVSPAPLR